MNAFLALLFSLLTGGSGVCDDTDASTVLCVEDAEEHSDSASQEDDGDKDLKRRRRRAGGPNRISNGF